MKKLFRAWNEEEKRMYSVERIDFYKDCTAAFDDVFGLHNWGNDILMQWTWLKDKNWVKIFEGDLLSDERDWERAWEIEWDDTTASFIAFNWLNTCKPLQTWKTWETCYWDVPCEKIWNIYENPELLIFK